MAKPLKKEDGDGKGKGHNSAAKKDIINKWMVERLAKERAIKKAEEAHIAHLKSDLSRLDKNVKTDSGVALKYLKANYKLVKLQEDAKEFLDEDAANDVLDDMRFAYEALTEGGQLDCIDALEAVEAKEDKKTDLKAVK